MKRKHITTPIGFQLLVRDPEHPEFREVIGRTFYLTISEIHRISAVVNSLDPLPDGLVLDVQAVRLEPKRRKPDWRQLFKRN